MVHGRVGTCSVRENWENTRLVIGPNASLSWREGNAVVLLMGMVSVSIGVFFWAHGLWPVMPFCGLEFAAFAAGLWVSLRRNAYREVITFEDDRIRVEFGTLRQPASASVELRRAQTRAVIEPGPYRNSPTRLVFECCGQRVEVALCLTDDERLALRQRVRQLIHPGWTPPAGAGGKGKSPGVGMR